MSAFIAARAGFLALAMAVATPGGTAWAAASAAHDSVSRPAGLSGSAPAPFGLATTALGESPLRAKWLAVERAIEAETAVVAACANDPAHCPSEAALRFLGIVKAGAAREGLARLGEINRAVNLAIRPVSDRTQYGVDDHWASPLATLSSGMGDCEDYAIAKLVALRAAGVPADDLRLVIIREAATGEDHAVVMARTGDQWRVLDNRVFVMIGEGDLGKYRPLFAIDADGAKRFEQPAFAEAAASFQMLPADIGLRGMLADDGISAASSASPADDHSLNLAM